MKTQKNILDNTITLFKGIDPLMLESLSPSIRKQLSQKTLKELFIIAESAQPGAASLLSKVILSFKRNSELAQLQINSLLLFGSLFESLNSELKKEVQMKELQQELNHFSRIMGLDEIITGGTLLPLDEGAAFRQCKDFARFMWLVSERRGQKKRDLPVQQPLPYLSKQNIKVEGNCIRIAEKRKANIAILVFSEKNTVKTEKLFRPAKVLVAFLNQFDTKTSVLLFDLFLFLTKNNLELNILLSEELIDLGGERTFRVLGTGGFVALTKREPETLINTVLEITEYKDVNGCLGTNLPLTLNEKVCAASPNASLFLFPIGAKKAINLSKKSLQKILNKADSKGKIFPDNNLKNVLFTKDAKIPFSKLKPASSITPQSAAKKRVSLGNVSLPKNLVNAKKLTFETAHLHADRVSSQTQFDTVLARQAILTKLKKQGFRGDVEDILMIDDYHVVNRLDYNVYLSELNRIGFSPDIIVPESSPLIRAVSIDVLKKLIAEISNNIFEKNQNLYLSLGGGKIVELIQGVYKEQILGCVLFDTAFSLFKKNTKSMNDLFNNYFSRKASSDINAELVNFYKKEKNPEKRKNFMEKVLFPFPKISELKGNQVTPFLDLAEEGTEVVNVHEIFYRPQQAKVNAVLELLGLKPITTAYINLENEMLIEQSRIYK